MRLRSPQNLIYMVVLLCLFTTEGFSLKNFSERYGGIIEPITGKSLITGDILIPSPRKLNAFLFIDIKNNGHVDALLKLNSYYRQLIKHNKNVAFIAIAKAESQTLKKLIIDNCIEMDLISDEPGIISKHFGYECGLCLQILITDRQSKLIYDSSRLDLYIIERLTDRYSSDGSED